MFTHRYTGLHNSLKTCKILLMPGDEEPILLDLAHITLMVKCVCISHLLHTRHPPFDLSSAMMPLLQFASKPARFCLHEYAFEKFKLQLCRLNISSNSVFMCVVLAPPHNCTPVSLCGEKLQLFRQKQKALQAL